MSKRDLYEILGVDRNVDEDTIKKAFRKLALQHHPDRNPGDKQAEAKFREASEAYRILADSAQRAKYDRFGHAAFDGPGAGFDFSASGFEDIFTDIFGEFFGGGRSRGGRRRGEECKGTGGKGGAAPVKCSTCRGAGQVRFQQGFFSIAKTCGSCGGRGQVVKDPCDGCSGAGRVRKQHSLQVKVPQGVDSGTRLKLRGEGETATGGAGDLYVVISVREHERFERDGNDVLCEVPIGFPQVALGAEIDVPTLEGAVKLKVPPGTESGSVFRLRGKGVPDLHGYGRGDQRVRVVVQTPKKLTARQRELLEELADISGETHAPKGFFDKVREKFG